MHVQGRRSSSRAGGAVKELRAMETYKKTKKSLTIMFVSTIIVKSQQ